LAGFGGVFEEVTLDEPAIDEEGPDEEVKEEEEETEEETPDFEIEEEDGRRDLAFIPDGDLESFDLIGEPVFDVINLGLDDGDLREDAFGE